MVIYHYDRSGVLLGAGEAKPSPAEGFLPDGTPKVWIIPAGATKIQPPKPGNGEVAVFDEAAQAWTVMEDHRGDTIWNTSDLRRDTVLGPGPIPEGWTTLQPQDADQKWDGSKWVQDTEKLEAKARIERNSKLAACDWTQLSDAALDDTARTAWTGYRQALRDYMEEWYAGKPWPEAPA